MRCVHEAQLHKYNQFLTLTYNDENVPPTLRKEDFQKFMKRYRKSIEPEQIRYYMAGEYGTENGRAHFHSIIFGHRFDDLVYYRTSESGAKLYTSNRLSRLWPMGFATIGEATFESAAYIARYCMAKITGKGADAHYKGRLPEYNDMSRRPGIGMEWYRKFKDDVYPHDYVVINGRETKPPKYYDEILEKEQPDTHKAIKEERVTEAKKQAADNTPERLTAKMTVTQAKLNFLKRNKS